MRLDRVYVEKVGDAYSDDPICAQCTPPIEADYLIWGLTKKGALCLCTKHFLVWAKKKEWLP
jgi:hypothetical protein